MTAETQIFYDKHKICYRYMAYIQNIHSQIARIYHYTYTEFDQNIVPNNLSFDYLNKIIMWDYGIPDCVPRSFYVSFILNLDRMQRR